MGIRIDIREAAGAGLAFVAPGPRLRDLEASPLPPGDRPVHVLHVEREVVDALAVRAHEVFVHRRTLERRDPFVHDPAVTLPSKVLATVVTLRLAERGTLDLDRDVNGNLRSWKVPASPLTAAQPVTLRLLLTHRAGINRPDKGLPFDDQRVPTLAQVLAGAPAALNQGVVVEHEPGSDYQYSNIGFLIVQLVLEDVTGKSFAQLAQELVFAPLGLKSSTLSHPLRREWRSRWGVPHDENGAAHARNQLPGAVAHGGLVGTPSDLARLDSGPGGQQQNAK